MPCDGNPNIVWGVCASLAATDDFGEHSPSSPELPRSPPSSPELPRSPSGEHYLHAFYWALSVMMGNDALPDTTQEKVRLRLGLQNRRSQ